MLQNGSDGIHRKKEKSILRLDAGRDRIIASFGYVRIFEEVAEL
jgi:hypothetical protein